MVFDASKYENQIRAILQAPGVDLSTISAKRVRKQLVEQNDDLTAELVKEHKEELDTLIGTVYEMVSAEMGGEDMDGGASADEHGKRKREDEDGFEPSSPSSPKKAKKSQKTDEELARQLEQELNGRDRPTRAAAAKPVKAKRGRKAKSAATVDSDADSNDGEKPKKKRGGFSKEYTLSEPLATLLSAEKMSRPQVVKGLWTYIKANDLQNPSDKREIMCDEKLKGIFGVDKIGMFKMNKSLGDHLYEPTAA